MSASVPNIEQHILGSNNIFTGSGDVYVTNQPTPIPLSEAQARKDLFTLLNKVKTFWIEGVLEKSIHNVVLLDLGKELQPGAVDHPWESILEVPDSANRSLPHSTNIVELFDQSNNGLLILGDPGSGKTITLLELARELITRVENDRDMSQPIPVVFNLSTWINPRLSLVDWLVSELSVKYKVPKRISRPWMENNRLLYLLDGLDEVKTEYRAACVEAINQFEKEFGLAGLVVCCRREEYTNIPVRLKLNAAISLQPLTPKQVDEYLSVSGSRLAGLRSALSEDETLLTLAESPLMLSVMSLAYQDVSAESLSAHMADTLKERRAHLFNSYVQRMFKRKGVGKKPYESEHVMKWLSWLAQNMIRHKQTIFLIEQLQPGWLPSRSSKWGYAFISRIMAGESILFPFILLTALISVGSAVAAGIAGVLLSSNHVITGLVIGAVVGIILGLFMFFMYCVLPALVAAPPFMVLALIDGLQFQRNQENTQPETTTRRSFIRNILGVGLIFMLYCGGLYGLFGIFPAISMAAIPTDIELPDINSRILSLSTSDWLTQSLILALIMGLIAGVFGVLVFGLRRVGQNAMRDIYTTEFVGWSWRKALRGGGVGLGIAVIIFIIILPLSSYMTGLSRKLAPDVPTINLWITVPLSILSYFLMGVLIGGLQKGIVNWKSTPNQGIRLSFRNSIVAGLVSTAGGTLACFPIGIMSSFYMVSYFRSMLGVSFENNSLSLGFLLLFILLSSLPTGVVIGLGVALHFGWRDVINHYTLRYFLWRNGKIPRKYASFLDYAADLIFLRKVGGGYIFIHRLLMEYFAELSDTGQKVIVS